MNALRLRFLPAAVLLLTLAGPAITAQASAAIVQRSLDLLLSSDKPFPPHLAVEGHSSELRVTGLGTLDEPVADWRQGLPEGVTIEAHVNAGNDQTLFQARGSREGLQGLAGRAEIDSLRLAEHAWPATGHEDNEPGGTSLALGPLRERTTHSERPHIGVIAAGANEPLSGDAEHTDFRAQPRAKTDHGNRWVEALFALAPSARITVHSCRFTVECVQAQRRLVAVDPDVVVLAMNFPGTGPADGTSRITRVADDLAGDAAYLAPVGDVGGLSWTGVYADLDGDGRHDFGGGNALTIEVTGAGQLGPSLPVYLTWSGKAEDLVLTAHCPSTSGACAASDDRQEQGPLEYRVERVSIPLEGNGTYQLKVAPSDARTPKSTLAVFLSPAARGAVEVSPTTIERTILPPADGRHVIAVTAQDPESKRIHADAARGPSLDGRTRPSLTAPGWTPPDAGNLSGTAGATAQASAYAALVAALRPDLRPDRLAHLLTGTSIDALGPGGRERGQDSMWGAGLAFPGHITNKPNLRPEAGLWWNPRQSGHGAFVDVQGERAVMAWYLYDKRGAAYWMLGIAEQRSDAPPGTYQGAFYRYDGPRAGTGSLGSLFDAEGDSVDGTQVGEFTLQFVTTSRATFDYELESSPLLPAQNGAITLQHQMFYDPADRDKNQPYVSAFNGLWNRSDQNGHGFFIDTQATTMVVSWYIYDDTGAPTWLLASGHLDDNFALQAEALQFTGPALDGESGLDELFDARGSGVEGTKVGDIQLRFTSLNSAEITIDGVLGFDETIELQRFDF